MPDLNPLWQRDATRSSVLRALAWLMLGVLTWQLINTALVALMMVWIVPPAWTLPRPHELLGLAAISLLSFQIWRWWVLRSKRRGALVQVVMVEGANLYTWGVLALVSAQGDQMVGFWVLALGGLLIYLVGYIRLLLALH